MSTSQRSQRAKELLVDVVEAFRSSRPSDSALNVHKIMDKYRSVIRLVRILPREEIRRMYASLVIQGKSTNSRGLYTLFYNAMLIAGTPPALAVADQLVRSNQVNGLQKLHYLLGVPRYTQFPTKPSILMFKQTVKQLSQDKVYGQVGLLSLASLTYQACVNSRVAEAKFPVQVSGQFCGPSFAKDQVQEYIVSQVWPRAVSTEQKAVVITAIGILGLPDSIPFLDRIIKDTAQSTFIRTKAVFAFKRLIQSSNGNDAVTRSIVRSQVLPKLMSYVESTSYLLELDCAKAKHRFVL
jgi:hypothetical protein